jgi:cobalt-zinc-cadmium efflux system outer membrane protein
MTRLRVRLSVFSCGGKMNSFILRRLFAGRLVTFAIASVAVVVLSGLVLLPTQAMAQASKRDDPAPGMQGTNQTSIPAARIIDLVKEVERNNPEIAAAYHGWQAATNVPKQAAAFPETQLSIQQFSVGSPRPFAGFSNSDFAYIGIGASQDIPFPGKRGLRGRVAELEANSMREDAEAVRQRLVEALKLAYFQLAYIQQTLGILQQNDRTLSQIQEIAESRYRVGQGNQQDVLRAQLQHTKILQEIAHHHQVEGQLQAQLKQILNRPQTFPDIVAEPLTPTFLLHTDAQLLERIQDQNPDVRAQQQLVQRQEARVELAHKNFRPDFTASYMYQHTASQFRDYYMATFGIRLPNRGRQKAELAEAEQNRLRAERELEAERQRVLSEAKQQYVLVRQSEERLNIYKGGLIPQAEATFQAGMAAYQANRQDFETLLSNFLDVLNLDLDYRRELAEHESALARLERLTGVALP